MTIGYAHDIAMIEKEEKQRTAQQRKALEVYCAKMAEKLNDAGYDQKSVLELFHRVGVQNTQESVKELFRGIATIIYPETMGDNPSTAKLDTKQIQVVYMNVDAAFSTRCEVSHPWPSDEPPLIGDDPV